MSSRYGPRTAPGHAQDCGGYGCERCFCGHFECHHSEHECRSCDDGWEHWFRRRAGFGSATGRSKSWYKERGY